MKIPHSRMKNNYIFRLVSKIVSIVIVVIVFFGREHGYEWSSYPSMALIVISVAIGLVVYLVLSKKPFAKIEGQTLIISSVPISKETVKSMSYKVINNKEHELHVSMEGYSDWVLKLTKEDVEISDLAVYKFIHNNADSTHKCNGWVDS